MKRFIIAVRNCRFPNKFICLFVIILALSAGCGLFGKKREMLSQDAPHSSEQGFTQSASAETREPPEPASFLSVFSDRDPPQNYTAGYAAPFVSRSLSPAATVYDTVILNARLLNPETESDIDGINIGILNGQIAAITKRPINGRQTIDAQGLVASPGFIDIDTYHPHHFGVMYKISDGVTTNLLMHGGTENAGSWYAYFNEYKPLINYGTSNLITSVRMLPELNYGLTRVMTSQEDIDRLCSIVETNLRNGALGISLSPEYAPGVQAAEILALSNLAAGYGFTTFYHLRYSTTVPPNTSIKAIEEVIDYAKETGVSVHILHITSTGSTNCAEEAFALIESVRTDGIDLTADIYPYDCWASWLGSHRFDPGWQERFGLTYNDLQIPNSTIRMTAETFPQGRRDNYLVIANNSIPEHEVQYALQKPYVMVASDDMAWSHLPGHPRGAGCFSRLVGRYSRELGVISLMEAIAKITYLPAKRMEGASPDMKKKGRIEIGADADITLFDYDTIIDMATNENVRVFSKGIHYVFVNGVLSYNNSEFGRQSGARPVYSYFRSPEYLSPVEMKPFVYQNEEKNIECYKLFGIDYADLRRLAKTLDVYYALHPDGSIDFADTSLNIGELVFYSGGKTNLFRMEPVIYRGSVYVPFENINEMLRN